MIHCTCTSLSTYVHLFPGDLSQSWRCASERFLAIGDLEVSVHVYLLPRMLRQRKLEAMLSPSIHLEQWTTKTDRSKHTMLSSERNDTCF